MLYRLLADAVVVIHLIFTIFVVGGGLLALRWPWAAWVHLPAAVWGVAIEYAGWICPLTPVENWLRQQSGSGVYQGGFVEHYLLPVLYPGWLTRRAQLLIAGAVLSINLVIYGWVAIRRTTRNRQE